MLLPFPINDWVLWSLILGLCLYALELRSVKSGCARLKAIFSSVARKPSLALWMVFLTAIALRLALLPVIHVPNPGIHDEFSYLLAADTFVHGRLANPPHPMWVSFETFHVNWHPTYSSKYPPAQGFVLAVGQLLGHPWIGVLLSVAAMCAAITWMLQGWLPGRWALVGGIIVLLRFAPLSYWMNGYWGGSVAAIGGALAVGALPRILKTSRTRDALWMALGLAILANSRPFEGFVLTLPIFAVLIWRLYRRDTSARLVALRTVVLPMAAVLICTALFMGYYNWRVAANPLVLPHLLYQRVYDPDPTPLFLWQKSTGLLHYNNKQLDNFYNQHWESGGYRGSWGDAARTVRNKIRWYTEVFCWPGALPLLIFFPFLFRDRRIRLLLWILLPCVIALLAIVWSLPHYAAPVVCIFYALIVQSMRHLGTLRLGRWVVGPNLVRALLLLLAISLGNNLYSRILMPRQAAWNDNLGNSERAEIAAELSNTPGKHLVFIRYDSDHNPNFEWVYNAADIDGSKIVWAREIDPVQDAKLRDYFHDRRLWLVEPDRDAGKLLVYTPIRTTTLKGPSTHGRSAISARQISEEGKH